MPLPRAGMLKAGAFGADAESRARFASSFFDKPTVDAVFAPGSIGADRIVTNAIGLARTIFVDPITGDDLTGQQGSLTRKFKTIQAAINAAGPGTKVLLAPGDYTESPALVSGITLDGAGRLLSKVIGNVSWAPTGDGVDEIVTLQRLTVTGDVNVDGTSKTNNGAAYLLVSDVSAATGTIVGRPGLNVDGIFLTDVILPESATGTDWTMGVTNGVFVAIRTELGGMVSGGDALVVIRQSVAYNSVTHGSTTSPFFFQTQFEGNTSVTQPSSTGPFAEARDCVFNADFSVGNGFTFDALDCAFLGSTSSFGSGTINRNDGPFQGGNPGRTGLVPAPNASDAARFLSGDGSWGDVDQPQSNTRTTTDATPLNIYTKTLDDQTVYVFESTVVARKSDGTERGSFRRRAMIYREGGGATLGAGAVTEAGQMIGTDDETDVSLAVQFVVSGNDVHLQITGLGASTIDWQSKTTFQQTFSGPQ